MFCFIVLKRYRKSYKFKVCGKSTSTIFFQQHFLTLCLSVSQFSNSHNIPNFFIIAMFIRASLVAQLVKNLPAMQETWV